MADLTNVVKHFPTASETYTNNLSTSISSLATEVPVNSAAEYDDGDIVVLVVEPGTTDEAVFTGEKTSSPDRFINCVWTEGNLGVGHASGATVTDFVTATHLSMISKGIKKFANQNGELLASAVSAALGAASSADLLNPAGTVAEYAGATAPSGWLLCNGAAVSRTNYSRLFDAITPALGTITITVATPGVGTLINHGLKTGDAIHLTTTGALPTGLAVTAQYFAIKIDANTIRFATSYANAIAGTAIATSGAQSGTHTLRSAPYGVGDGSTTFNVPDSRGRVIAGKDDMGGTAAGLLTNPAAAGGGVNGTFLGATGGSQTHTLTTAQQANATGAQSLHGGENSTNIAGWSGIISTGEVYGGGYKQFGATTGGANSARYGWTINLGFGGGAHNNMQPTLILNHIIKT